MINQELSKLIVDGAIDYETANGLVDETVSITDKAIVKAYHDGR